MEKEKIIAVYYSNIINDYSGIKRGSPNGIIRTEGYF